MRVSVSGGSVEVALVDGAPDRATLVFLHEGLGSIGLWRDFPTAVAKATGRRAVVYSRLGHGHSDPGPPGRSVDYMHREALDVLPELLAELAIDRPVLVGHSDGASIALIYAGLSGGGVSSLVLIAPHVFVEAESIDGITAARDAFTTSDLPERMARHHDDAAAMFWRWNDVWLSPEFRSWNIEAVLPAITAPTLVVQGTDDEYGTLRQVDAIEHGLGGPVERLVLDGCGHAPHVERSVEVVQAVTHFLL